MQKITSPFGDLTYIDKTTKNLEGGIFMRKKLSLVKDIYFSKKEAKNRYEEEQIYKVLLSAYIKACVFGKKESFTLHFAGKYVQDRKERISDWINYCKDRCYEVYLKSFKKSDDQTLRNYSLIHYGASKPVHIKVSNCPNEVLLENILRRYGFKITDEHFYSIDTEYVIGKAEPSALRSAINGAKKMSKKNLTS